jgi:hypothetical protein
MSLLIVAKLARCASKTSESSFKVSNKCEFESTHVFADHVPKSSCVAAAMRGRHENDAQRLFENGA